MKLQSRVASTGVWIASIPPAATVTSATVPVTGLNSATAESYGGQNISHVPVTQGTSVTLPAQ